MIMDLNAVEGDNRKEIEKAYPGKVIFADTDVTKEESVQKAVDAAKKAFGAIHGVINSAGVGLPRRVLSGKGAVHPLNEFAQIVNINLVGTFNVLRLAVAEMAKNKPVDTERGVIINVASVAAYEGQIGQAAYSASKGGVVAMTLPIARELGKIGMDAFGLHTQVCIHSICMSDIFNIYANL